MSGALTYPHPQPPAPGSLIEVARGVHWLRMPLPFALDHINLWLLEDGDGWVLVDCGYGNAKTRDIWDDLLAGRKLNRIIVTHFHPDHLGLAGWLEETRGAPVWMTEKEWLYGHYARNVEPAREVAARLAWYRQHGLSEARIDAMRHRGHNYPLGVPILPSRYHRIRDGDRLLIGGRRWEVVTATGHAPEQALLLCREAGVMISGDQVLPRISPNVSVWPQQPDADPLTDFVGSLVRLRLMPGDVLVLPSHGLPFYGLHDRLRDLEAHHQERLETTLNFCATPLTVAELMEKLFPRAMDAQQTVFAFAETAAHVNHLIARGELVRAGARVVAEVME